MYKLSVEILQWDHFITYYICDKTHQAVQDLP